MEEVADTDSKDSTYLKELFEDPKSVKEMKVKLKFIAVLCKKNIKQPRAFPRQTPPTACLRIFSIRHCDMSTIQSGLTP